MEHHCENCRFYRHLGESREHPFGECRRRSPLPTVDRVGGTNFFPRTTDADRHATWPLVAGHDWCGEYHDRGISVGTLETGRIPSGVSQGEILSVRKVEE